MTPGQALYRSARTRIGSRWVAFVCAGDQSGREHHVAAVWDPAPPSRWKAGQLEQYRRARDAFLAELGAVLCCKPIVIDGADLEGVGALREAAEVLLSAQHAGVVVDRDGIHGDPALLDAWRPTLDRHSQRIADLLAARPVR